MLREKEKRFTKRVRTCRDHQGLQVKLHEDSFILNNQINKKQFVSTHGQYNLSFEGQTIH